MVTTDGLGAIIHEVEGTADAAKLRAQEIALDTHHEVLPVRVFRQGPRTVLSGVLPIRVLCRVLQYHATDKGTTAADAVNTLNRPVIREHVRVIEEYLLRAIQKNDKFIIPGMTLNATKGIEVYLPRGMAGAVTGYAVLPDEAALQITDGQHRFLAIRNVVDKMRGTEEGDRFMNDGVPIMITVEEDLSQIHQDFADAGKTKPLPPSLLSVYELRQPSNKAVFELCNKVPLFKERIDATSKNLSILSSWLFLVNQVRQYVKTGLTGTPSLPDPAFAKHAQDAISDPSAFNRWVERQVIFLKVLTDIIPEWKKIADLPKPKGPEGDKVYAAMKEIRATRSVSLSAAALNALGLLSFRVLKDLEDVKTGSLEVTLVQTLEPLRSISWDRSDAFWQGNIVEGDKIKTQTPNIKAAAQKLIDHIHKTDKPVSNT